jgi:hypothetical protein
MTNNKTEIVKKLEADYPFLTYIRRKQSSTLGIVQNVDNKIMMIYDFSRIQDIEAKKRFLSFGEKWWYETNTMHPIEIYIGRPFDEFTECLVGYSLSEIIQVSGPSISLDSRLNKKRIKKRRLELVKEV